MTTNVIDELFFNTIGSSNCSDGEVRLVEGRSEWEGRVEVCLNRVWGTVCNISWDYRDAWTVCSQLTRARSTSHFRKTAYHSVMHVKWCPLYYTTPVELVSASVQGTVVAGRGPIFFRNVHCNFGDHKLIDCNKQTDTVFCHA